MPAYNSAKTIERAIKSLECQSHDNWKAIIVDDGSTDNTKQILNNYKNNPRFKLIYHEKNKGRGAARQTALENAEGDYIAFLDADDFYHPDKLKIQLKEFEVNQRITLVGCSLLSFDQFENFKLRGSGDGKEKTKSPNSPVKFVAAGCMVKLKDVNNIKYNPKLNAAEDVDFLERGIQNKIYLILPDVLYYYEQDQSLNNAKISEYYSNTLKKHFYNIQLKSFRSMQDFFYSFLKLVFIRILILFKKTDFLWARRGRPAPYSEIKKFKSTLTAINSNL